MREAQTSDYGRDFVTEVLRTGLMLTDLVTDLIEGMPEDAYPGESCAAVVIEMLIGSLRPVLDAAGEESVRSAIALLTAAQDRTLADMRRAVELSARRERTVRRGRRPGC
ncbi:MAG TPA: hypothetical protein VG186_17905 [Solirubrobacteraceae bacterium]|jgi:hypothetical protein|nr:hypothetical protein [Solirubrobacteraceae bacterium]